jgi:AAA+ superfamily predicted ATPase
MARDLWLPRGYELPDGSKIASLLFGGENWQIFDTTGDNRVLLASPDLALKWDKIRFLTNPLLDKFAFGRASFYLLFSHKKFALEPLEDGKAPGSKVDALAFSWALKECRRLSNDVSFHDAIYMEQFSRLLPTWTLTPRVDDKVVLGTWLTGGVIISTDSFRRLTHLTGWLSVNDLVEIIEAAGLKTQIEEIAITSYPAQLKLTRSERVKNFRLPGRPKLEEFFNEYIIDIVFNAEKYQAMGIAFPSAVVLHGPPGCGKTFAVGRLVEFLDWPSYSIDSGSVGSPYIHDTSRKITELFDNAIKNAPSVVVIDEMESFLSDRQTSEFSGLYHVEEVNEFLRRMPEASKNRVLVLAMTNMIDAIDPAVLRRGRFDHVIEMETPSRTEVESLLDFLLKDIPKLDGLKLNVLHDALTGRALSDSAFVVREAARLAVRSGKSRLDQESLEEALARLPDDKKKYPVGFIWE